MLKLTDVKARLRQAVAREIFVVVFSFWFAVIAFFGVLVLGNVAVSWGYLKGPADLRLAGRWFLYSGGGWAYFGTMVNVVWLLLSLVTGLVRRRPIA